VSAAAVIVAGTIVVFLAVLDRRARRRRRALREALHEVRRPLQAMMLRRPPGSREGALLAQLRVAIADLERAVEGRRAGPVCRQRVSIAELLGDAEERWAGSAVTIEPPAADARLEGDRVRLGMALDNLIANGLEHGDGDVRVASRREARAVRLEVVNGERSDAGPPREGAGPPRGNGLRIAGRHAGADGGRVEGPRASGGRIVAAVELPGSDPGPTAA
jgi:signal transduction histidine kinase